MHIAEVDLNYTQYHPLSETYISLYPQKKGGGEEETNVEETTTKPPMWAEVEKCMEDGTLNRLRNRASDVVPNPPRPLEIRPVKKKPQPEVDTSGMNRRQRRTQLGIREAKEPVKTKNRSMGFEKNQEFGALEGARNAGNVNDGEESDGGFFEE